jgi:Domain of unknown function (DUF4129)
MNRRRVKSAYEPSIVDTIITGVAPALIICMISSLVFFLIVAFYRSEYSSRLMYILGLYTFATVLVARIAIESGRAHANIFGIALFAAACVAMFRFVTISGPMAAISPVINVGLLLVAWYLADRITFDCTLVDERQESTQKGLLQSLNLVDHEPAKWVESTEQIQAKSGSSRITKRKAKQHNPGVWVLYFALLAIPLFGLGQVAIPDEAIRRQAFIYLLIYLACALTLLLTTSFVGMRRYLRQRGVEMPNEMTRLWLAYGTAGIAFILVGCLILPLPTKRGVGFAWLPFDFTSPQGLSTSNWGWGKEGPKEANNQSSQPNSGNPTGKQAADAARDAGGPPQENGGGPQAPSDQGQKQSSQSGRSQPNSKADSKPADSKSSSNDQSNSSESKPKSDAQNTEQSKSDQHQDANQRQSTDANPSKLRPEDNSSTQNKERASSNDFEKKQPDEQRESVDQPKASPSSNRAPSFQLPSNLGAMLKWILIAILIGVLVIYALTHPKELAQLWSDLMRIFEGWFGSQSKPRSAANADSTKAQLEELKARPFSSFSDPFREGSAMDPRQIVAHTFAALEAWAEERGNSRAADQTAEEFARSLARKQPKVASHATGAAQMLDRVMFAGWSPSPSDISNLAQLWLLMKNN